MSTMPRRKSARLSTFGSRLIFALTLGFAATAAQAQPPRRDAGPPTGAPALQPGYDNQPRVADARAAGQPAVNQLGGNPAAGQQRAPFVLSQQEQMQLDRLLLDWERKGKSVKNFQCEFTRWEYDPTFGPVPAPGAEPIAKSRSEGELRYAAPDKGMFHIYKVEFYDLVSKKFAESKTDYREKWICNGQSIFEFDGRKKQMIERKLPPQLQGKAISEGPLPFLFGSDASTLSKRYFLRLVTPTDKAPTEVWIEALPRFQQDASNFSSATLVLNSKDLSPAALSLVDPGNRSHTTYVFTNLKENGFFNWLTPAFWKPSTPFTWTYVLEKTPTETGHAPPATPNGSNAGGPQVPAEQYRNDGPRLDGNPEASRPGVGAPR